jgi:hypothetical protein
VKAKILARFGHPDPWGLGSQYPPAPEPPAAPGSE